MLAAPSSAVREKEVSSLRDNLATAPHRVIRPAYIGALALFSLIVLQYCLFRQYSLREVTWAHPTSWDQSVYLLASYEDFEKLLKVGLVRGTWEILMTPSPNGVMLPAQASFLYLLVGASRLSAFTLLFLYFAAAEAALVWSMRGLSRSWAFTVITVSLFLLSASRFFYVGSLFDFRIDSVSASLYLITICIAIRSRMFASRWLSILCGASAGLLVLFRFVAIAYTGALFAISFLAFFLLYLRSGSNAVLRLEWKSRAVNSIICSVVLLVTAGPILLRNAPEMLAYYGTHLGSEKVFRQAELGLASVAGHLLFYPISLYRDHLGMAYVIGILVFAAILLASGIRCGFRRVSITVNPDTREIVVSLVFCAAATLIPLVLFTMDVVKSPVVACVLVGPTTLMAALAGLLVMRSGLWDTKALAAGSAILGVLAVCHEFSAISHHSLVIGSREEENELLATYRAALDYAKEAGWNTIYFGHDRINDYTYAPVFTIMQYEWSGEFLPTASALGGTNYAISRERALADLDASNLAILTVRFPRDASTIVPFDRAMRPIQQDLRDEAAKRMVLLRTVTYNGHEMAVLVRAAVKVNGVSGNWLTSDGASLSLPCKLLEGKRALIASGSTIYGEMIGGALNVATVLNPAAGSQILSAKTSPITSKYSIDIDLRNANVSNQGSCDIELSFDRYFVPKEKGINVDTRKLVVQAPTDFKFE